MIQQQETRETAGPSDASAADCGEGDQRQVTFTVEVEDEDPLSTEWLAGRFERVLEALAIDRIELSVVIVDDARMAALHQQYLNDPSTTDVLTFDLRDQPAGPLEGEICLCRDEAARRAAERGHDVSRELLLYAVHGLLHLLGYDDHEVDAHAAMHAKEDELLTAIGVGPVYRADGG
jgi:probable rRNA maturation factor